MARTNLKRADAAGKPNIDELSFVGTRKPTENNQGRRDFWTIEETGDWVADNEIGKAAAIELANYMRATRRSHLLGSVIGSMIERGRFGGVEVGFMQFFAEHAQESFARHLEVRR